MFINESIIANAQNQSDLHIIIAAVEGAVSAGILIVSVKF